MAKGNSKAKNATKQTQAEKPLEERYPTDAQLQKDGFTSLSSRIREYSRLGASNAEITKLALRSNGEHPIYQHVRLSLIHI